MGEREGAEPAVVDAAHAAGEVDVGVPQLQTADQVVQDAVGQVAGGDDHAGDAVGADEAGGVLGRGQPQVAEPVALGLVALAGHADDAEAQIGVALHEVDEVGAFALGADDHDISEVAALAARVGEPGPEDRPTHDQQHERQDAARAGPRAS